MSLTDEQLRDRITALPADVDVDADLSSVRARCRARWRQRRAVVGVVGVVFVALAGVAIVATRDHETARRSVVAGPPSASSVPSVTTTTLVAPDVARIEPSAISSGPAPDGAGATLSLGDGSVWIGGPAPGVTGCHVDCGRVTRIDSASRNVVATITVPKFPRALVYGFDAVWAEVEVPDNSPAMVVKLDPVTNRVVAETELTGISIVGSTGHPRIAVGAGAVWLLYGDRLFKIDPTSGTVVDQAQVPFDADAFVADDTGLWLIGSGVVAIDPSTFEARQLATLKLGYTQSAAVDDGTIWLTEFDGALDLYAIDTQTGSIRRTGIATTNVAAGGGRVWFQGYAGLHVSDTHPGWVVELDPATGRIARAAAIDLAGITPPALAVDGTTVWVLGGGMLWRIRA